MKLKSEKGFTGIDITVAIIIITLFVSIISVVFYNFTKSSKAIERKTEATYIATDIIEKIKALDYDNVIITDDTNIVDYKNNGEKIINVNISEGYTANIKVENYKQNEDDLVKMVTVTVSYKIGKEIEKVELTTTIVREV